MLMEKKFVLSLPKNFKALTGIPLLAASLATTNVLLGKVSSPPEISTSFNMRTARSALNKLYKITR